LFFINFYYIFVAGRMVNSIELFKNSKDKNNRYALYQMLRSIATLNIGSDINSKNYLDYLR